jgi:hypothetical protein
MNSLGLSGYDRDDRDHYPTPSENVGALVVGLQRAGIAMPRRILDPSGGEGAIARMLNPSGFDVRLTDLHPGEYRAAREFYATTEPLDARNISDLGRGAALTRAGVVLTNPPYSVSTDGAIVKACLTLLQEGEIEPLALMHLTNHLTQSAGMRRPRWSPGSRSRSIAAGGRSSSTAPARASKPTPGASGPATRAARRSAHTRASASRSAKRTLRSRPPTSPLAPPRLTRFEPRNAQ